MSDLIWRCSADHCRLPWMTITNGTVVVESRHYGNKHVNVLSLKQFVQVLLASKLLSQQDLLELAAGMQVGTPVAALEALLTENGVHAKVNEISE